MIIEIVKYIVLIGAGGLTWYYLDNLATKFIDNMLSRYPAYYSLNTINLIKAINHWFILFMLLGAGYSLYVIAQRKRTPEGYY